ncbi:hypothetical protein ACLB2K_020935 [Fragaria x ananassa]
MARTRTRKERVKLAREGQSKRLRSESRSGCSGSLAEITQALEGTGEVQPYLAQMAYDMRHHSQDMHALEEADPLAGNALAKEKLTRAVSHPQGDAEAKCQRLREAEEHNCVLSERLAQVEQNAAVFQDQAAAAGREVAELKEAIMRKDEQVEAGELAVAKVASLEAEVVRLTQSLAELEMSWKAKCGRAAGAGWINESAMRKWYAEKNAAKVAWEQMTPEQRKQAEISQSLAKQHEVWRVMSSAGQKGASAAGDPRPLATVAASSVKAASLEGSIPTQVVVSQVTSSVVPSRNPRAPGLLALAHLDVKKSTAKRSPGPEGVLGSSLVHPTAAIRPSFLSQDQSENLFGQRVSTSLATHPLGENCQEPSRISPRNQR